ncbi:hypothetical protein VDIAB_270212 [Vibrio diabolicus]|nr:hypothetical protein VDIAB_270212 [Vibrio diabolicus]
MVRKERLELSHLAAPEPKSGASTNSATSATYSVVIKVIGKNLNNVVYGGYDGIRFRHFRNLFCSYQGNW